MLPALLLIAAIDWRALGEGLEYAEIRLPEPALVGEPILHAVRIDPDRAEIGLLTITREGGESRTAAEWCKEKRARIAINAGMFALDHRTHVGRLTERGHVNSEKWNDYQSVLLFAPRDPNTKPRSILLDRDSAGFDRRLELYTGVAQNLRLIRAPGRSVWKPSDRRWSEAAIAIDDKNRILFVFSRAPYSMNTFNRMLLSLPLGIISAHHVEGGPEASLSIHTPKLSLDLAGSFETGFFGTDGNDHQWPLPSVLIVK